MTGVAWLLPALPLLAALTGLWLPRRAAAVVAVAGTGAAAVLALPFALATAGHGDTQVTSLLIAPAGGFSVTVGTIADGLAGVVALMVGIVATLVQIYSVAYMHDDSRYRAFAAEVSLFTAAMLAVVLSADLLTLLVGWEVMGLCSYLLIGHYRDLPVAPGAALKAFLVTRIGDVGFLLGILLLGTKAGTFRIPEVIAAVPRLSHGTLTLAALLLLMGVAGKSAQFPLHTWLPDAMAGPTPISALIHAATMVAAGVYLVLRLYPLFEAAPAALATLGVMASITMLLGALSALGQDDIKRVMAWSTVSQLAYMLGALAVGGVSAGGFHLLTHAAFKALLFLCSGVILHEAGTVLMSQLGGARKTMPVTYVATVIGGLALVGVPPVSGWLSKDAVLEAAWSAARGSTDSPAARWVAVVVLVSALTTVVVTGAYVTRLILRTFHGTPRSDAAPHDPPGLMRWPIIVLAAAAVLLGGIGLRRSWLPSWLSPPGQLLEATGPELGMTLVALGLAAIGVAAVALAWRRDPAADPVRLLGAPVAAALRQGLYIDALQDRIVVRPVLAIARMVSTTDRVIVDGAVEGTGVGSQRLGRLLARLEAGNVQGYLTGMIAGAMLIVLAVAVTS